MKSYISFDYMLSYYGLIPERVYIYTCATCGLGKEELRVKNKSNSHYFVNIPKNVFNIGLTTIFDGVKECIVATREKALCDKLYSISLMLDSLEELKYLLFEDLRIDEDIFSEMNKELILEIAPIYGSANLNLLIELINKLS